MSMPAQNANQVPFVVLLFRKVIASQDAPDQKTKLPSVSPVLGVGEPQASLRTSIIICRKANPTQN